ncbi:MAG: DksA/TraR family C4-type zinc finger protein [Hasllibacter sp.]
MAGGWTRDGAVGEQIEAAIQDELARMRARPAPIGESAEDCAECGEPIAQARRTALPGVKLCARCAGGRERAHAARPGINRRGSKDSQLK